MERVLAMAMGQISVLRGSFPVPGFEVFGCLVEVISRLLMMASRVPIMLERFR